MKITDFALIFVAIILPIIITVYVNVSYTIKAEEQEMYYTKIINIATEDAANQMKEVESNDAQNDYGYSGLQNSKISINPEIGKDTFLNTLYNNFGIKGNPAAESYLQTFIPVIAILDYNGVYISSQEKVGNVVKHVVKPKVYYSYSYSIDNNKIVPGINNSSSEHHTVEFTMDDYIIHRGTTNSETTSFYISDSNNNSVLCSSSSLLPNVVNHLLEVRKQVITDTITKQIAYYTNAANAYAKNAGINYDFVFPTLTNEEMSSAINNVGIFAFVQGLNSGNKYLNAKAYSVSQLDEVDRYYFSLPRTLANNKGSKYKLNLYHQDENCPEYKISYHNGDTYNGGSVITPAYVITKQQAASAIVTYTLGSSTKKVEGGFYPCPICNP